MYICLTTCAANGVDTFLRNKLFTKYTKLYWRSLGVETLWIDESFCSLLVWFLTRMDSKLYLLVEWVERFCISKSANVKLPSVVGFDNKRAWKNHLWRMIFLFFPFVSFQISFSGFLKITKINGMLWILSLIFYDMFRTFF